MRRIILVLLVLLLLASGAALYFFRDKLFGNPTPKSEERPRFTKDLDLSLYKDCKDSTENTQISRVYVITAMKKYLSEAEGVPISTSLSGGYPEGTKCFVLSTGDYQLFQSINDELNIIKDGKIYKSIPRRYWIGQSE